MKKLITNYSFRAADKQVIFLDYTQINLNGLLLITNVTDNIIIYNFASSTAGGTVLGNVLTLTYNTAAMDNKDTLQIFYEDGYTLGFQDNPLVIDSSRITGLLEEIINELRLLRLT